MNFPQLFHEIEQADPEVWGRLDTRRAAMQQFGKMTAKAAAAALPLTLTAMFQKAYAQSGGATAQVIDVLNLALTLEHLEADFYSEAVDRQAAIGIPAGAPLAAITLIRDHERAHVTFLQQAVTSLGGTPSARPTFDFTAGGTFSTVFTNYDTFLAVAQAFEDTGVRAYKGQAANLNSNNAVLTAALQIHSLEARHAAHIRFMRQGRGAPVDPWIRGNDTGGIGNAVAPIYAGEEVTSQAGINIAQGGISAQAASEAFDEPLTRDQVLAIVTPFIV